MWMSAAPAAAVTDSHGLHHKKVLVLNTGLGLGLEIKEMS